MSEEILKALMQLFALITFSDDEKNARRKIVEAFLLHQLNSYKALHFIAIYDEAINDHRQRFIEKNRFNQRLAATSVKALKIASEINDELTYYQKIIVIIQLVEFLNSVNNISEIERDFIDNVSQILHIDIQDYQTILSFVLNEGQPYHLQSNSLVITGQQPEGYNGKVLLWHDLSFDIYIAKLLSANVLMMRFFGPAEVTINGQLADPVKVHILRPGVTIRGRKFEPLYFSELQSQFQSHQPHDPICFEADNISYYFNRKVIGLHPMSFSALSGNLVGIMGDSGAGKTTLVNLLCGINQPTTGKVLLNGNDIHKSPESIKGSIGYVSQDDLLIEDLTVYQNLYFNAKLCFDNLSDDELKLKIDKILESLGLYEVQNMKVGSPLNKNISGGQRKRLNIALELIREPSVLFLDEPTSGLSSRDSENIIDLLKELTSRGKLVFVVIHQPSSDVFKMFNQLLVLDTGGYLIYNGEALSSIPYFKQCINHANFEQGECPTCGNVNAEQVLNIVHAKVLDEYGAFTGDRKIEPSEWYKRFQETNHNGKSTTLIGEKLPDLGFKIPGKLKQLSIFFHRDALSKFSNKQYLYINLFEAPLLALLLSLLLRYYNVDATLNQGYKFFSNPNVAVFIIISVIIAFFIGLTVSAEEIINDRKLLKRESFLNLSRFAYLASKVVLLALLSAIQMALFVWVGNDIIGIKYMYWHYWLVLFSTAVFANLLGLIVSDTLKKTVNIYILVPFLIIPQLILSGVFVSYDKLNPRFSNPEIIPWYGEAIVSRWAFEALAVNQFANNRYQKIFFSDEMVKSQAAYMKDYWVPSMINRVEEWRRSGEKNHPNITLLKNELSRNYPHANKIPVSNYPVFSDNELNADALITYLNDVKSFYRKLFNLADSRIDNLKVELTATDETRSLFLKLKEDYHNEDLEVLLKNNNRLFNSKIIEYHNSLIQKSDPIYKEPKYGLFSAHFYAPVKRFGVWEVSTFYANLLVIWGINFLMMLVLYFKLLALAMNILRSLYQTLHSRFR